MWKSGHALKRRAVRQFSRETLLTGHLSSLEVPEMLYGHLQDVRLLQFRVSGALMGRKTHVVRITHSLSQSLAEGIFEIY